MMRAVSLFFLVMFCAGVVSGKTLYGKYPMQKYDDVSVGSTDTYHFTIPKHKHVSIKVHVENTRPGGNVAVYLARGYRSIVSWFTAENNNKWSPSNTWGRTKVFEWCGASTGQYSVTITGKTADYVDVRRRRTYQASRRRSTPSSRRRSASASATRRRRNSRRGDNTEHAVEMGGRRSNKAAYKIWYTYVANDQTCKNGGVIQRCGSACNCPGKWKGADCGTCGITQSYCKNGGTLNTATCACACSPSNKCGYTGNLPQIRALSPATNQVIGNCSFPFTHKGTTYTRCIYGDYSFKHCRLSNGAVGKCDLPGRKVITSTPSGARFTETGSCDKTESCGSHVCSTASAPTRFTCNTTCQSFTYLGKTFPKGDCAHEWLGHPYPAWCYTNTSGSKTWGLCPGSSAVQVETKKTGDLCAFPFVHGDGAFSECTAQAPKARAKTNKGQWCYVSKKVKEFHYCTAATKADTNDDCSCTCYGGRTGNTCKTCSRTSTDCPAGTFSSTLCNCDCSNQPPCKDTEKMDWRCKCKPAVANEMVTAAASQAGSSVSLHAAATLALTVLHLAFKH